MVFGGGGELRFVGGSSTAETAGHWQNTQKFGVPYKHMWIQNSTEYIQENRLGEMTFGTGAE